MTPIPPLETEDQARHLPAVRHIYAMAHEANRRGVMTGLCREMLSAACRDAGVELGAYDERILGWLSQWEPQLCATVAGWVERAHEAGQGASTGGAA